MKEILLICCVMITGWLCADALLYANSTCEKALTMQQIQEIDERLAVLNAKEQAKLQEFLLKECQ